LWSGMGVKIKSPPEWGIDRVPERIKELRTIDFFVLWSSLGIGLLVFEAGAFLSRPFEEWGFGLGLGEAFMVSLLGSIIGSFLLAAVGVIGARESIPTMVSLRPGFGIFGSYLPTILNIIQLVGWASFELIIMGEAAESLSGLPSPVWILLFGVWAFIMAIWGPSRVVREWLEKFAIWFVYGSTIWITYMILTSGGISTPVFRGTDLSTFLLALDLVIAMPVSWIPLISDYNRFARKPEDSFRGTFFGYLLANTWFYFLGAALYLLYPGESIVRSIAILFFGNVALLLILVDETDNAFADIYSAAVSLQNINPKVRQWIYALAVTVISIGIALTIPLREYENFLLLIGASFIPVTAILLVDYFIVRGKSYNDELLYKKPFSVRPQAIITWIVGFIAYNVFVSIYPVMGATLPTLGVTALIYYVLSIIWR